MDLSTTFCNVNFRNPLILASGFLGVTASSMINIVNNGAGGVTIKSLGPKPRLGHHSPTIITWNQGMMNAVGLSNPGIDLGIKEMQEYKNQCDAPLIASIFAFKKSLFGELAEKVKYADLLEINISCPNVEHEAGTPFALDCDSAYEVTKLVKQKTNIPVIVKLSPNSLNIKDIAKKCEDAGADAINMGNTLGPGLLINIEAKKPILANKFGGISGGAIKPITLKRIWDIYEEVKIPIIGTGGVYNARDAIEMIMAGASLVGIGTAIYENGPETFEKINQEIFEFMKKHGYNSIYEMIGVAHD
jgi:dihydroorotate dehydrogenase (NAD+) catalytic subunit